MHGLGKRKGKKLEENETEVLALQRFIF